MNHSQSTATVLSHKDMHITLLVQRLPSPPLGDERTLCQSGIGQQTVETQQKVGANFDSWADKIPRWAAARTRRRATMRDRRARGYSSASTSRTHTLRWGSRAYSSTLSSSRTSACTPPLANSSVVVCPALVSSPHFAVVYGSKRFHECVAQLRHQHGMICNW